MDKDQISKLLSNKELLARAEKLSTLKGVEKDHYEMKNSLADIKALLLILAKDELAEMPDIVDVEPEISKDKGYEELFLEVLKLTLTYEGGYVNHPNDPGGATNFGVTQKTYNRYNRENNNSIKDVKDITHEEVSDIYYYGYWLLGRCHEIPYPLSSLVFDSGVNCGVRNGIKFMQRTLNGFGCKLLVDGKVGPKTIASAKEIAYSKTAEEIVAEFNSHRQSYYYLIAKRNPKLKVFLNGWKNRLDRIAREIK